MAAAVIQDVFNGIAPIETTLVGVRPRLHLTPAALLDLRGKLGQAPWSRHFTRVRQLADAGHLPDAALVYRLTGEAPYLASARQQVDQLLGSTAWPKRCPEDGFVWKDMMYSLALGYDWLYEEWEQAYRTQVRDFLHEQARKLFVAMAQHTLYPASLYTHNYMPYLCVNLLAAAGALFGEVEGIGAWLRYLMEKIRAFQAALSRDGASQEGLSYGGCYIGDCARLLDLVRSLLGWDVFAGNAFLAEAPNFYLYSMLGHKDIQPRSVYLSFADSVRYNWHGPDATLRKLAVEYHNPAAMWAADVQESAGASKEGPIFLNLLWDDPALKSQAPAALPTLHHFADKDQVFMRSGWDGHEAVFGFHCGPHAGHHALRNYPQCIGGGHMAPNAGSFLLFAHGDWLISDGWYSQKFTEYHNTVRVNGIGQTGEGGSWFQCQELRREKRGPSILRADHSASYDYLIGNVAPAYEHTAKLTRFLRHVLYVRPDCWVLVDELVAADPATFELYFHAFGDYFKTDRPFLPAGERAWRTGGKHGSVRITALAPPDGQGFAEVQQIKGIGAHRDREMCILRLRNTAPAQRTIFITVLEAYPTAGAPRYQPVLHSNRITLGEIAVQINPGRPDPAEPALRVERIRQSDSRETARTQGHRVC